MKDAQQNVIRAMNVAQRLRVAERLYFQAWRWKAAMLRSLHPDWTGVQVKNAVKENFSHAGNH